jgi:hypothetical protein
MNTTEIDRAKGAEETLVIAKADEGFRVCSPLNPGKQYLVTGLPDQPQCTCQEFASHDGDPEWLCAHILAVLKETGAPTQAQTNGATAPAGSRGSYGPPTTTTRKVPGGKNGDGAVMLLKRSVSPDGRIDSLSVEFSCPIGKETPETLKQRAEKILALQAEIAAGFLKTNGNGAAKNGNGPVSAVPGQLLAVASMNGRYGKRLFLNVLVNGQVLKFFGSEKQLAEAVTSAGYGSVAGHVADGYVLNLPCRVVTKPSQDGKYINIEQVLPAQK